MYAHETYFRHLRLYDFVLKNTKLSEVKRVHIPIMEPICGDALSKALVLADENAKIPSLEDVMGGANGLNSIGGLQGASGVQGSSTDPNKSQDISASNGHMILHTGADGESATDSDMDEVMRTSGIERPSKNILHRANKDWSTKIAAASIRDVKTPAPDSRMGQRKK